MKNSHRPIALLLALCVIAGVVLTEARGASDDVCFLATNDKLLELTYMPYFSGGNIYVPCWMFGAFKINYSYLSKGTVVMLYTEQDQVFFDLTNTKTYDAYDNQYSDFAVYRNGEIYLPVDFVCDYFGLSWSYIVGRTYGNVIRVKDRNEVLDDAQFIEGAYTLMKSRYEAYIAAQPVPVITPGPSVTPGPSATPEPNNNRENITVYITFTGLPADDILSILSRYGVSAGFFLTIEELEENPDMVRKLYGAGHKVGVLCTGDCADDWLTGSRLIYDAAFEKTLLITSDSESSQACLELAENEGLAYWNYSIDAAGAAGRISASTIEELAESSRGRADIRFSESGGNLLRETLKRLTESNFSFGSVLETNNYEG